MLVLIVNHYVKPGPGMVESAIKRLDGNGDRMREMPGFAFRYRMVAKEDPLKLTTVTGWESEQAYEGWLTLRRSGDPGPVFAGESPYARTDTEMHLVERQDLPAT